MICLIFGSASWLMKMEHEVKLDATEMSLIRWTCQLTLKEKKKIRTVTDPGGSLGSDEPPLRPHPGVVAENAQAGCNRVVH